IPWWQDAWRWRLHDNRDPPLRWRRCAGRRAGVALRRSGRRRLHTPTLPRPRVLGALPAHRRGDDMAYGRWSDEDREVHFTHEPLLPAQTRDDTDVGWGERERLDDDWWRQERPPHWDR